jgi:hypothetical protein
VTEAGPHTLCSSTYDDGLYGYELEVDVREVPDDHGGPGNGTPIASGETATVDIVPNDDIDCLEITLTREERVRVEVRDAHGECTADEVELHRYADGDATPRTYYPPGLYPGGGCLQDSRRLAPGKYNYCVTTMSAAADANASFIMEDLRISVSY